MQIIGNKWKYCRKLELLNFRLYTGRYSKNHVPPQCQRTFTKCTFIHKNYSLSECVIMACPIYSNASNFTLKYAAPCIGI
jgi:hypothetical protein